MVVRTREAGGTVYAGEYLEHPEDRLEQPRKTFG